MATARYNILSTFSYLLKYMPCFVTGIRVAPEKYGKNIGTMVAAALWEERKALLQPIQTVWPLCELVDSTKCTARSVELSRRKRKNVHPPPPYRISTRGMYRLLIRSHTFHSYCRENLNSNNYRYWLNRTSVLSCHLYNSLFKIIYCKYIILNCFTDTPNQVTISLDLRFSERCLLRYDAL
jgi:hypothetical protein